MLRRYDLTDGQWDRIKGLMPANDGKEGRPFADHRLMLNACFWHLHTGSPWRDLPDRFGPWQTAYNRFRRWRDDGTLHKMLSLLLLRLDAEGRIDPGTWCADSTVIRAHPAAAGGGKKGATRNRPITPSAAAKAASARS
jgi:transposase